MTEQERIELEMLSRAPRPGGTVARSWIGRARNRWIGGAPLATTRLGAPSSHRIQVATARFLATTAYGDADSIEAERRTIRRGIQDLFGVTRRQAWRVVRAAENDSNRDGHEAAAQVRDAFDTNQRMRIMGLAWELAYADGLIPAFGRVLADRIGAMAGLHPEQAIAARSFANPPWI
ncbi:MAG: TerB family tellurite resistance protein [Deltaproteobacteria bacterium]|nr:TerB family tellurite resistance protein [Deltaproteobacteria bacterium]